MSSIVQTRLRARFFPRTARAASRGSARSCSRSSPPGCRAPRRSSGSSRRGRRSGRAPPGTRRAATPAPRGRRTPRRARRSSGRGPAAPRSAPRGRSPPAGRGTPAASSARSTGAALRDRVDVPRVALDEVVPCRLVAAQAPPHELRVLAHTDDENTVRSPRRAPVRLRTARRRRHASPRRRADRPGRRAGSRARAARRRARLRTRAPRRRPRRRAGLRRSAPRPASPSRRHRPPCGRSRAERPPRAASGSAGLSTARRARRARRRTPSRRSRRARRAARRALPPGRRRRRRPPSRSSPGRRSRRGARPPPRPGLPQIRRRYENLTCTGLNYILGQTQILEGDGCTMAKVIGIDLGTTNSCMAVIEGGEPTVIPNAEGGRTAPSVVAFTKDDQRLVGAPAKRQQVTNPQNTIFSIKRFMGRKYDEVSEEMKIVPYEVVKGPNEDVPVKPGGKEYAPTEISAMILQKLKTDAESYLGDTVTDAVITVPAYFNNGQRE